MPGVARNAAVGRNAVGRNRCKGQPKSVALQNENLPLASRSPEPRLESGTVFWGSESSSTPTALGRAGCTVVWSNAAYRSELVSSGSSSSSSQGLSSLSRTWTGETTTNCSASAVDLGSSTQKALTDRLEVLSTDVAAAQHDFAQHSSTDFVTRDCPEASTQQEPNGWTEETEGSAYTDFEFLSSTKKTLADLPAFREVCPNSEEEDEDDPISSSKPEEAQEAWVHGPDRDLENELFAAVVEEELEDEADRKLEAELQSGIAALSRKLAGLHSATRSDPPPKSSPLQQQERPVKSMHTMKQDEIFKNAKKTAADSSKLRTNVVKSKQKPKQQAATASSTPPAVCLEEQLRSLRLSPHFWGKNFDWVRSLRSEASSKAPAKARPRKEAPTTRVVLEEKKSRAEVADTTPKGMLPKKKMNQMKENRNRNLTETQTQTSAASPAKKSSVVIPSSTPLHKAADAAVKKLETKGKQQRSRVVASRAFNDVSKPEKPMNQRDQRANPGYALH